MKAKIALTILFVLSVGAIALSGCLPPRTEPPRRHDCPPESLLVDISVFPDDFVGGIPMRPLPDEGGNSIGVDMANETIHISHDILPFRTPKGAERRFAEEVHGVEVNYPELRPVDTSSLGLHADQVILRCGKKGSHPRCIYQARYDNFYIEFILRAPKIDDPMSVLTPALKNIDEKMMMCFAEHPAPEDRE